MFKRLTLILGVLLLVAPAAFAQAPPPPMPPPMPGLMIPLPEGMMPPPPEEGPEAFEAFLGDVFAQIAGDDGVMTLDELQSWMKQFEPPMEEPGDESMEGDEEGPGEGDMEAPDDAPGGEPDEGDIGMMPEPPECSDELVSNEQLPMDTGVPCGGMEGNKIFRTVCNASGFNTQAISLPEGRMAGCFGIEAITPNVVIFSIYPEDDPTNVIFDSDVDGLDNISLVKLEGEGSFVIELDMSRSDPDARVTVVFVDHPAGM